MSYGLQLTNNENKIILDTSRPIYQFIGKYTAETIYKFPLGNGNDYNPSSTLRCVGGNIQLPTGISNTPSDWLVFFRYVPQDVEFTCGPVIAPALQSTGDGTMCSFTGLVSGSTASGSTLTFIARDTFGSAIGFVKPKVGDYIAVCGSDYGTNGYQIFNNPRYAYVTDVSTSASGILGTSYTISLDRSISVNINQFLVNITAAQQNRLSVSGMVNFGVSIANSDLEFYVFCRMNNNAILSGASHGMRTYDSNGNCTFDSNRRALNIAARSSTPNLSTLPNPMYSGYASSSTMHKSTILPSYSPDVGVVPANWAVSSGSGIGYYFGGSGCQNYRANYTYTNTGAIAYGYYTLYPCVTIEDKSKIGIRTPQLNYIQPYNYLKVTDLGSYFLTSANNNQLVMLINTDQYQ